nr:GTP-binding protein [Devosia aurantiaca]
MTPTTINLLTGFLGSGKTTLLQRLLDHPDLHGTAVLINEFGEVGLDHHLLDRIDANVVLMKSGCLCCTVRGEIADALLNLHAMRARGEVPWFDRVVIETTGLADPIPFSPQSAPTRCCAAIS